MTMDNGKNKIWIELPVPKTDERGKEIADLANKVLSKLGVPGNYGFMWMPRKDEKGEDRRHGGHYIKQEGPGGYLTCTDHGHWFNLDYLTLPEMDKATGWNILTEEYKKTVGIA